MATRIVVCGCERAEAERATINHARSTNLLFIAADYQIKSFPDGPLTWKAIHRLMLKVWSPFGV